MKPLLMHPDRDFDTRPPPAGVASGYARDIALDVLLDTAAGKDRYVREIMAAACAHAWTNDSATILYRQAVLADCVASPAVIRALYAITAEPFGREHGWNFDLYGRDAAAMVGSGVRTLQGCLDLLRRVRDLCARHADRLVSPGFRQLLATLRRDLDDAYLEAARADLDNLGFRAGLLLSARVGDGGKAIGTMLRKPRSRDLRWMLRLLAPGARGFTYRLAPRDDAGAEAFAAIRGRGLGLVSDAIYQSAGHTLHFIGALRAELAFYVGCLGLREKLGQAGERVVFPVPCEGRDHLRARNLRDPSLTLTMGRPAVGSDIDAEGRRLVIITGANRGGKSTFLRGVGLAQLMLQCGMFVTADAFAASLHSGLFTHYKREEDRDMRSGKFDEELVRMDAIAGCIHRSALVLFNESFAATHEREGAEIARQIVAALLDNGVTVLFVSHMYAFARAFLDDRRALFLRADRNEGGARSFRLAEAKPLPTSFGADLYERIFGAGPAKSG